MQVIINLKITFMIDNLSEFFQFGRKAEVASLETESRASLPPLAYRHRENIISQGSFYDWLQYIKAVEKSRNPQADLKETERIYRDLYEKHLRILSKSDARSGLKAFAEDINQRYSPDDTAILLWGYSSEFFYNFMRDKIKPFQVLKYKPRYHTLESSENPGVAVDGAKYDNILFVDDWVLSAAHLGENILSADVLPSKIRPYFLVMSDTGLNICRQNGIDPKFIYRISLIEDDGKTKTGGMSGYPIYGFHKVPDMIPSAFTAKLSGEGKWSIFPRIKGEFIAEILVYKISFEFRPGVKKAIAEQSQNRAQKITEARPPQAAELTFAQFGSNFFVNLDQSKLNGFSGREDCSLPYIIFTPISSVWC